MHLLIEHFEGQVPVCGVDRAPSPISPAVSTSRGARQQPPTQLPDLDTVRLGLATAIRRVA